MSQTERTPTLILGGGLMGLAIAHQLARRGMAVRVISRKRREAAGFVAAGKEKEIVGQKAKQVQPQLWR